MDNLLFIQHRDFSIQARLTTRRFLFLCAAFSSLLATEVSLSTGLDFKLQPEKPVNAYYSLRGSAFILNCTLAVGNVQALNVTWKHNGKWLGHEVEQVDSSTVQLKLSNTSRINNGFYWCGPKLGNRTQGINISLTVADPPSPPHNLRCSVIGVFSDREYHVRWSASSYTGGLPVNYSIKLCLNTSMENETSCKILNLDDLDCRPENVLRTDFLCVLKKPGDFISGYGKTYNYTISVVAENAVGSAKSSRYVPYVRNYLATPWPPSNFTVVATDKQNELRVSWTARSTWKYSLTEYTVLYHAKNDMENETKVVRNKTGFTLLTTLEAFMEYYIYLVVRFVGKGGEKSAPSEVQGPLIVKTRAGEPDTPSKVIRDWSVIFPGNPALRNVTVEWELADNVSWRGTQGEYVVVCKYYLLMLGSLPNCEYHVDATSNRAVLQKLDSAKSYLVYIKMCNKEKLCGPGSEPHMIKKIQDNSTTPMTGGNLSSKQITLITVSALVGCMTALFAIYVIRKWRQGQIREIFHLRNRISLPPPVPATYDYVDPLITNDYDQVNLNENQV